MGIASLHPSYERFRGLINPSVTTIGDQWESRPKGPAHALPRRTQSPVRLVVDRRSPDAGGDPRADAERHRAVAGGEPAGRGAHRARSLPLLQPSRDVPAAVAPGDAGCLL